MGGGKEELIYLEEQAGQTTKAYNAEASSA